MKKSTLNRILSMVLAIVMSMSLCIPAFAYDKDGDSDTNKEDYAQYLVLIENSDGTYEISSKRLLTAGRYDANIFAVKAVEGSEVYSDIDDNCFLRISNNSFVRADCVCINAYDVNKLERVMRQYDIQKCAQDDLRRYADKVAKGIINPSDDVKIYIPTDNFDNELLRLSSNRVQTRTYRGYKNRQYYEELIVFSGNSLTFNVRTPQCSASVYFGHVMEAGAKTTLNAIANKATGGTWTLLSVFCQLPGANSIPTTQAYDHTAALIENKMRKYTYVVQDGEYYVGSIIDYANKFRFKNYISIDGYDILDNAAADSPEQSYKVDGYDKADELAFRNYLYTPYTGFISSYYYKNTNAGVETRVDSLL